MLLMTTVARKEQRKWSLLQRSNLGLPHFLPPTHGAPSIMSEVPEEGLNPKFQLLVCGTVWRTGWMVHIPSSLSRVERTYWLTLVDYTFLGLCVFTEASLKVSMYTTKGSLPAWWFHMQNADFFFEEKIIVFDFLDANLSWLTFINILGNPICKILLKYILRMRANRLATLLNSISSTPLWTQCFAQWYIFNFFYDWKKTLRTSNNLVLNFCPLSLGVEIFISLPYSTIVRTSEKNSLRHFHKGQYSPPWTLWVQQGPMRGLKEKS